MSEIISSNLTRGTQAAIDRTPVEHGKLRWSTDTQRLFMDYNNIRIEYTDIIRGLTDAQIKNLSKPADKIYVATDTHYLYYPTGSFDSSNKPIYILLNEYHVSNVTVTSYDTNYYALNVEWANAIGTKTSSRVVNIPKDTYLSAISTAAANAQSTANTAVSKADTAQGTANTAVSKADAAQGTANTAVSKADAAQGTANTAVSKADAAQGTADKALPKTGGVMQGYLDSMAGSDGYNRRIILKEGYLYFDKNYDNNLSAFMIHGMNDNRNIDMNVDTLYVQRFSSNPDGGIVSANGFEDRGNPSSKRYKTNIKDLTEEEAKKILDVDVVSFDYLDSVPNSNRLNKRGVIAEQVLPIIPSVVKFKEIDGENLPDSVDYSKFVPYLIKMIQIQQEEIEKLKKSINTKK